MNRQAIGLLAAAVAVIAAVRGCPPNPPGPPDPPPGPTTDGTLICLRPWSLSLDDSDADLTIRETIDASDRNVTYLSLLPETVDTTLKTHAGVDAYRRLVPDQGKPYVFHVTRNRDGSPTILHQGGLDAGVVLGWVGLKAATLARGPPAQEDDWLDVDFSNKPRELLGALEPAPWEADLAKATWRNVRDLPGFEPIPRREWAAWTARFPTERRAAQVRHITRQVMGSCVGHSGGNSVEGGVISRFGMRSFRRMSMMSLYVRIGSRPNSGAYVGDAASELHSAGILPADGETNSAGQPYTHTHQVSGGFYDRLPSGWKTTAQNWRCQVYIVDDEESAFRVLMDWRLRTQFGRDRHALSGFCVTSRFNWAYENSWGVGWGDDGRGYDSRFYYSYVYSPALPPEIPIPLSERN